MHSSMLNSSLLALGLFGTLASASHFASIPTNSTDSAEMGFPDFEWHSDTDLDMVGHSLNETVLAEQHELAKKLVPLTNECPLHKMCDCPCVRNKKFLVGDAADALGNVTVTMKQVKKNPITLEVSVLNNGTLPLTFWRDLSPLSSYAADLGYFHFDNEIPNVKFGVRSRGEAHGYRPYRTSHLTQVDPGQTESQEIEIPSGENKETDETWLKMFKMGGKTTVSMSGQWYGVWAANKTEVMKTDMEYSKFGFNFWNDIFLPWGAFAPEKEGERSCKLDLEFE